LQYLDLRFKSRLVRCIASFTYVVRSLLNLGVTVFTPCVALKTVIGLPYWASILSITAISIIFTIMVTSPCCSLVNELLPVLSYFYVWFLSLVFLFPFQGGLKAAITADVVQGFTMIACSLAIIIYGCIDVGGFGNVIDVSSERGRLQFFK
jgi:Na+/proline symporter